jgi:hypothetical protein
MDNDSRMYSVGGILNRPDGSSWSLLVRRVELNRDGSGTHAISDVPVDLDNVELRYSRDLGSGNVIVGVGSDSGQLPSNKSAALRGFLIWQQGF